MFSRRNSASGRLSSIAVVTFPWAFHAVSVFGPRPAASKLNVTLGRGLHGKEHALLNMIDFLVEEKHMTPYMLSSVAVDLDITQLVDGNVGVHAMCPKNIFSTNSTK
jgi:acetamidase/formamidase